VARLIVRIPGCAASHVATALAARVEHIDDPPSLQIDEDRREGAPAAHRVFIKDCMVSILRTESIKTAVNVSTSIGFETRSSIPAARQVTIALHGGCGQRDNRRAPSTAAPAPAASHGCLIIDDGRGVPHTIGA